MEKKMSKDESSTALKPRESAVYIALHSDHVKINENALSKLADLIFKALKVGEIGFDKSFESDYHPKSNDPRAADWLFVLNTLNFCFWSDNKDHRWQVENESGWCALAVAIKRAIEKGIPITDAKYYSKITKRELEEVLKGDPGFSQIPLIEERLYCLHNAGKVLLEKYNGTFMECLKVCENSAQKLLELIVRDFECFRDESMYKGQRVSFYKRAQIMVSDVYACFKGESPADFKDIESLTMFADYRVPQVLAHFETLKYSESLLEKLKLDTLFEPGCPEETEIRGCSIEIVERTVQMVKERISKNPECGLKSSDCNSALVDYFLWSYRRKHKEEMDSTPFHKVRTIYY